MRVPVPGPHDLLVRVRARHDLSMELAAALTLWITFGAWLVLPTVNAPTRFSRITEHRNQRQRDLDAGRISHTLSALSRA